MQDDLNPDVRTTSERRLALLEDELAKAEQSNVEKKMVQRYRGVKFFGVLDSCPLSPRRRSLTFDLIPRLPHRAPEAAAQDQAGQEGPL